MWVLLSALPSMLSAQPVSSEASFTPTRPRIGLVLSGGGARGAAHVGVLKVLEELNIPIDAIAGTSMGAVVGGLYAAGMSAGEIETAFASLDWEDAFRDRPQRLNLNFRRKREDRDFLVRLPLGLKDGRFQLPPGLIQGQKLTQILRRLTQPVSHIQQFDDLPIRFRAVATDLETGAAAILSEGDLASALRASLSAPGIFAPVEREGRVLVDGGIAANLPVSIARAMQVDTLIVVDVGFPLAGREVLDSVANVSNQMLAIMIRRQAQVERQSLGERDILLEPPLKNYSSFDFSRLRRAMTIGEQAARDANMRLAMLSVNPDEYQRFQARRSAAAVPQTKTIAFVRSDAASAKHAQLIALQFGDFAGQVFDANRLEKRMNEYYGQGLLESLDYRWETADVGAASASNAARATGLEGLTFSARSNRWGPNYVRFGLRLQDDFSGNSTFDAATRITLTELNANGAEWVWDGQVGGNPRLGTEIYLPFSPRQRWFVSGNGLFQIRNLPQIEAEQQVGELRVRSTRFGLDMGRALSHSGELRAGLVREIGSTRVRLGDTTAPDQDFRTREYFLRYSLDRLDNVAFPRHGSSLHMEWQGQLEDDVTDRYSDAVAFDWRMARSWGRNTALLWASAGSQLDAENATERSYYPLGGFLNLSGVPADALTGPHYAIARAIYFRQVGNGGEGFLNVPLYAGMSFELGNTWERRNDISVGSARKDVSLFFGLDTFLGPAYFAAGYDSRGRSAFYLSLGRGF